MRFDVKTAIDALLTGLSLSATAPAVAQNVAEPGISTPCPRCT